MKRKAEFLIIITLVICTSMRVNCQLDKSIRSIAHQQLQTIKTLSLPAIEHSKIKENQFPYRYGISQNISCIFKNEATLFETFDGKLWQLRMESKNALSLGIYFKKYYVPPGSQLLIYNEDRSIVYGAFSELNNCSDSSLAIADFPGDYFILEYYEPSNSSFEGQLIIGRVTHAFKDIFDNKNTKSAEGEYTPGINCDEGNNMQDLKHAVCKITFSDEEFSYICSGSLINNLRNDGTPYYLTAAHCLTSSSEASTVVAWFDYEENYCDGPQSTPKTLSGAEIVSSYIPYDFTLLLFMTVPPASYQPYYAGWDAQDESKNLGFCIHHPNGKPKKISITNQKIVSFSKKISWDKGNISPVNSHWEVDWDIGDTEQGSSGSSLFDSQKRIIGQLHGGSDSKDYFGKLSMAWQTQSSETSQLKKWLDPDNTGKKIAEAYVPPIPPEARLNVQFNNPCVGAPLILSDSSLFGATSWLWEFNPEGQVEFLNNTTKNSQHPQITFLQEGLYDIYLTAGNDYGTDTRIKKGIVSASQQIYPNINGISSDTFICGCTLNKLPITGAGASHFMFEVVENADHFNVTYNEDTMFLTLKDEFITKGNFKTSIKAIATHGNCFKEFSQNIDILIPVNDYASNAVELKNGYNGTFDNKCASVEKNEPSPPGNSCNNNNSWCPETNEQTSLVSNSIWFKFEGTESGLATIATTGFDNQLAIYQSDSFDELMNTNFELIAANDDQQGGNLNASIQKVPIKSGRTYWVQLDGSKGGVTGKSELYFYNYNIEVSPNPSLGNIDITICAPQSQGIKIIIYSTSGQKVYSDIVEPGDTITEFSLNPRLKNGVYILTIKTEEIFFTRKILIF